MISTFSVLGITGCGISSVTETVVPDVKAVTVSGSVYGGSLPVNGAHVYLFAANTAGFAGSGIAASTTNASVSLLKSAAGTTKDSSGNYYVSTTASGGFSLSGDYSACTAGQQLYIYANGGNAMGGDPTQTGGTNGTNSAIGLLAALGNCSSVTTSTVVHLSEMSTIAAAYALAGFATDATHIADDETVSANSTKTLAQTGMANAFFNVNNLVNPATGTALSTTPGSEHNGTVPTATLNTLANILAGCVQSQSSASTPCSDLFTFTGTPTTADTATAAINLAHNPVGVSGSSVSVSKLFGDIEPQTAFTPSLSAAPNDFTVAISFGNANHPTGIAVNGNGDIWTSDLSPTSTGNTVASYYVGANASYSGSLQASSQYSGAGYTSIALDLSGNPVAPTQNPNFLIEFAANGHASGGYGLTKSGIGVAFNSGNFPFVPNNGQSPVTVSYAGPTPFTGGSLYIGTYDSSATYPADVAGPGIAADYINNLWVNINGGVGEFLDNSEYKYTHYLSSSISAPAAIAIGTAQSVWVVSAGNNSLVEFTGSATSYTAQSPFTGGGLNTPNSIAMDGAGTAWVSNSNASISGFTSAGVALTPAAGFTGTIGAIGGKTGPLNQPTGIAVDGSGNVWVSDNTNVTVMFVGLGAPAVDPLVEAAAMNKIATRP
jgi:hypothetical protein